MERLSGALMVLAGVALGAYSFLPAADITSRDAAEGPHVAAAHDQNVRLITPPTVVPSGRAQPAQRLATTDGVGGVRVFSPNAPLVATVPGANGASTTTWTAVVTTERSSSSNFKSAKAGDAEARAHLTSDLQRELKRVGCYGGEINGAWTQSTRRAMALFMERVNASLPANEPDYILLTLVQGHTALACGTDCPAGEVYGSNGRCLPAAVVAQANRRAQRLEERVAERRQIEQRKAAQQEQLAAEQRIAETRRVVIAQRAEAERLAASRVAEKRRIAQRLDEERLASARIEAERTAALRAETQRFETRRPETQHQADAVTPAGSVAKSSAKYAAVAGVTSERLPWLEDPATARIEQRPAPIDTASATPVERAPLPGMMSVGAPRPAGATVAALSPSVAGTAAKSTATVELQTIARDSIDRDELSDTRGYTLTAPSPRPAQRPEPSVREAALVTGLPGTKAGVGARAFELQDQQPPVLRRYSPAKIIHRPSQDYGAARVKRKYGAYKSGGKTRRGQPRPGTSRYNVMLSLGGIY